MTQKFQASTYVQAGGLFVELAYILEPAVSYIKSKLRTYCQISSYYAAESDAPFQVNRNFDAFLVVLPASVSIPDWL